MAIPAADPAAAELDSAFKAAMSGPPKPREAAAPPEVDHDAPHGRGTDGEPLAPYGLTRDGKVRKSAAGRRAKDDAARIGDARPPAAPSGAGAAAAASEPFDFSGPLGELHDAVWMGLSGLSMIGPKIPVIGRKLSADKTAAVGYVWRLNRAHHIKAATIAAEHNAAARAQLAKLAAGNSTWVLMCAFTLMPSIAQVAAVIQGDDALREMNPEATVRVMADLNKQEWAEAVEGMKAQAAAMAAQAQADVIAEAVGDAASG